MWREMVKRWANHKVMVRWLSRFFHYLDRYFIAQRSLLSLKWSWTHMFPRTSLPRAKCKSERCSNFSGEFSFLFHIHCIPFVFTQIIVINTLILHQIDQEREGEQIDRALLKNVLDIFVEIGMGQMEYYEKDFEDTMLKDTAAYYSRKASNWILDDSCPDYMLKVCIIYDYNQTIIFYLSTQIESNNSFCFLISGWGVFKTRER